MASNTVQSSVKVHAHARAAVNHPEVDRMDVGSDSPCRQMPHESDLLRLILLYRRYSGPPDRLAFLPSARSKSSNGTTILLSQDSPIAPVRPRRKPSNSPRRPPPSPQYPLLPGGSVVALRSPSPCARRSSVRSFISRGQGAQLTTPTKHPMLDAYPASGRGGARKVSYAIAKGPYYEAQTGVSRSRQNQRVL